MQKKKNPLTHKWVNTPSSPPAAKQFLLVISSVRGAAINRRNAFVIQS